MHDTTHGGMKGKKHACGYSSVLLRARAESTMPYMGFGGGRGIEIQLKVSF